MDKAYWYDRWQQQKIEFDQPEPNTLLVKYFNHLNLKANATIFVPLCGKSIDMWWLAQQGYHVIGVELSLEACRAFFTQHKIPYQEESQTSFHRLRGDKVTLLSGDFFDLRRDMLGPIDAIYDRAAIIALPQETRCGYAKHLEALMSPDTKIFLATLSYDQNQMQGPPFSVDKQEIHTLFKHFNISLLHEENAEVLAAHLTAKRLTKACNFVFLLTPRNSS